MWNEYTKRMFEFYNQYQDMVNNPFASARLPPRANHPLGISMTGKLKDNIIRDNSLMFGRLSDFYTMFQQYASGLFDLAPNQFGPDHPMRGGINSTNSLQSENEQLKKENTVLKKDLEKQKQK
jgi:hypothetical protein